MTPERILRAEAVAAFLIGCAIWLVAGGNAIVLLPALLLPDVSMAGYLGGPRLGALTYNLVHNWVLAFGLLAAGVGLGFGPLVLVGAVVLAHVGADRALGYGLKLPTSFHDTHLGRIGRREAT
ncbi:MAG TPA: DUF4260 domain-containing protein [Candidatus Limnocylindrales bacterium]|jgi:hypothetical protein